MIIMIIIIMIITIVIVIIIIIIIILWDFSIQTDHVIEARRQDLVAVDKKEKDKIEKYQDLARSYRRSGMLK